MISDRMKVRYDRAANTESFQKGQLVLLYTPQRKKGLSPFLIKRLNDFVYSIKKANRPRTKMKVVHIDWQYKEG